MTSENSPVQGTSGEEQLSSLDRVKMAFMSPSVAFANQHLCKVDSWETIIKGLRMLQHCSAAV